MSALKKNAQYKYNGCIIVQSIWTEISCLVNLFFCFIVSIKISGTMMLNGGSSINGMDERLINLREE
jgi:hypothetical protein